MIVHVHLKVTLHTEYKTADNLKVYSVLFVASYIEIEPEVTEYSDAR
jgi:hypothetical protein